MKCICKKAIIQNNTC